MNINISGRTRVSSVQLSIIGCRYKDVAHFRNSTEDNAEYKSIFSTPSIKRNK